MATTTAHHEPNQDRQRQALAVPTRRRIFELIEAARYGISVVELAGRCDVHQNTVRLHLAVLRDAGLIAQEIEPAGRRGRPGYRYRAIGGLPPDPTEAYRQLAGWLAQAVRTHSSPRATGRRIGLAEADEHDSDNALTAIHDVFTRLGFAPSLVDDITTDQIVMVMRACPYAEAAIDDPATICSLHLGMVEGIAGQDRSVVVDRLDVVADPAHGGCQVHMKRRGSPPTLHEDVSDAPRN